MEIVFATTNKGKLKEIREIITEHEILSLADINCNIDVVEDGTTFMENATKKALEIYKVTKKPTMSDDSGIEIDFLDKKPGVLSARFLGEDTPYEEKNAEILKMLKDVPTEKRTARFVCHIAFVMNENEIYHAEGTIEGIIANEIAGSSGFGYDPIFYVPEYKKTTAELSSAEKNEISHRGKALRGMLEEINKINKI